MTRRTERLTQRLLPARLGRPFRWLLAASWSANLADGIALAAFPLLVASQTRNPLLVALATLLQRLPWLLFGLLAGVLADRLDRRRLLVGVQLARVVVLGALVPTILTGRVDVAVVLAAAFVLGTAETLTDTTSQTLLPMLVDRRDLGIGNARLLTGFITLNQMAGPPLGAFLFAVGLAVPFVAEAVVLALAALLLSRMSLTVADTPVAQRPPRAAIRRDVADGLRFLWANDAVRTLALTILTFNLTFGAAWSVLVLYAIERLGTGEVGFGLLTTAIAVGGLVGTAAYGWLTRHVSLGNIMRAGLVIETLTHLALALTTTQWVAMLVMVAFGAHGFVWITTATAVRQRAVPDHLQGRVASVYLIGLQGGIVVGSGIGGLIATRWGVTGPFWFGFVGSALLVVLIWRQLTHIAHTDEARSSGG